MQVFTLKNGKEIPVLGLGTWKLNCDALEESLRNAAEQKIHHFDCAFIYQNQKQIGTLIEESGIAREKLFITSKLWRTSHHKNDAKEECNYTLRELRLSYLDLYLIHWPNRNVDLKETLEALKELQEDGKIHSIGVSNFTVSHLEEALRTEAEIVNNQVEFHPFFWDESLYRFAQKEKIVLTAHSPFGGGKVFTDKTLRGISKKYNRSVAQVVLAWIRKKGVIAIPKSTKHDHFIDNYHSLELMLDKEDIELIDGLNTQVRIVNPYYNEFN